MTNDAAVHWVPLIDMGVAINSDGARDGLARGIFLQSSVYDHPLIACVWPGSVYFPDFNHPGSEAYWIQALKSMNTVLNTNPTGFWIDMNENSNFIAGERHINEECPEANPVSPPSVKPEIDDNLYIPFHVAGDRNLANKTTTMSTMHYNGSDAYLIPNQHSTELFFHPFNNYGE
jgi:alpha-glucosidase (family GH31 glycosyl hydrolase)